MLALLDVAVGFACRRMPGDHRLYAYQHKCSQFSYALRRRTETSSGVAAGGEAVARSLRGQRSATQRSRTIRLEIAEAAALVARTLLEVKLYSSDTVRCHVNYSGVFRISFIRKKHIFLIDYIFFCIDIFSFVLFILFCDPYIGGDKFIFNTPSVYGEYVLNFNLYMCRNLVQLIYVREEIARCILLNEGRTVRCNPIGFCVIIYTGSNGFVYPDCCLSTFINVSQLINFLVY